MVRMDGCGQKREALVWIQIHIHVHNRSCNPETRSLVTGWLYPHPTRVTNLAAITVGA